MATTDTSAGRGFTFTINFNSTCFRTTKMFNVSDIRLRKLESSNFVIPFHMEYTQDGREKRWDLIKTHFSVAIIIYNVTRNVLICVRQFRPGVYINSVPEEDKKSFPIDTVKYPPSLGVTTEFCAGIIDKNLSIEGIAAEEVYEECGYQVPVESLHKVQTFRSSVGVAGEKMTLFYVEVTDEMKTGPGGGLAAEGELIEVVELSMNEARNLLHQEEVTTAGEFLFGLWWFFCNKKKELL